MTAGSRCSFLRAACCERIVKWCKLTIKGEKGTRATSEKRKLYASIAYPAWKAFLGEFVEKVGTRGMKRGGEGRGGEGRKENCFLFTVWTGGPKGRDHNFFDGGGGGLWGGGGWKIFSFKHCFICSSCCKQYFCVSVFLQTHLFVLAYNLFQCLQPLQTIYFKIFQPPTPSHLVKKNNGPSLRVYPGCQRLLARFPVSVKQGG